MRCVCHSEEAQPQRDNSKNTSIPHCHQNTAFSPRGPDQDLGSDGSDRKANGKKKTKKEEGRERTEGTRWHFGRRAMGDAHYFIALHIPDTPLPPLWPLAPRTRALIVCDGWVAAAAGGRRPDEGQAGRSRRGGNEGGDKLHGWRRGWERGRVGRDGGKKTNGREEKQKGESVAAFASLLDALIRCFSQMHPYRGISLYNIIEQYRIIMQDNSMLLYYYISF